jgi:carboxyl-terminal processing protease
MELPNGSALILSVAKYYGPDGKAIEDDAVTPNVEVASEQDLLLPDDEGVASQTTEPVKEQNRPDDQLNKALDLLKQKAQVSAPRLAGHAYPVNA